MGNEGIIALAVIGVAAVGVYMLNVGGIKDSIDNLLGRNRRIVGNFEYDNKGNVIGHGDPPPQKIGKPDSGPCPPRQKRTQGGLCVPCGYGGYAPC